uniref:Uncharacterized protein n=1 Tax=Cacopsylla melanoneura TaxID=428564 RepID=A0A8D8ZJF3_9HEMI
MFLFHVVVGLEVHISCGGCPSPGYQTSGSPREERYRQIDPRGPALDNVEPLVNDMGEGNMLPPDYAFSRAACGMMLTDVLHYLNLLLHCSSKLIQLTPCPELKCYIF